MAARATAQREQIARYRIRTSGRGGFRGTGSKSGSPAELSGTLAGYANDNITDLGATSTTAFTGYFTASSNLPTGAIGQSFILGETVLNLNDTIGTTNVRFVPRFAPSGLSGNKTSMSFKVDGVFYALDGHGALVSGGIVDADAVQYRSVCINCVPEPSPFGMIVPTLIALAGFRRGRD